MIPQEVVRSILVLQYFFILISKRKNTKRNFVYTKLIFSFQLFFPPIINPKNVIRFHKMSRLIVRLELSNRSARLGNAEKPICGNSQSCEEHKLFRIASDQSGNCRDYLFLRGDVAELAYCIATATTRRVQSRLVLKHGRPSVHIIVMSTGVNLGLHRSIIVSLFKQLDRCDC